MTSHLRQFIDFLGALKTGSVSAMLARQRRTLSLSIPMLTSPERMSFGPIIWSDDERYLARLVCPAGNQSNQLNQSASVFDKFEIGVF